MTDFQIGTPTDIPKITVQRESAPNPFHGHFPSDDKAIPVTITGPTEADVNKQANRLVARARQEAATVERTARKSLTVTSEGKGKAQVWTATLLFWTVAQQVRPGSGNKGADAAPKV